MNKKYVYQVGNNKKTVIEFIITTFIEGSTCFQRHTAHHQEPQTVFAASGLYTRVTGRCQGEVGISHSDLTTAGHYMCM